MAELCRYSVVKNCMIARDYRLIDDEVRPPIRSCSFQLADRHCALQNDETNAWNLWWQDISVSSDRVARLRAHQRINHWPGMACLHTKTGLAETLGRMAKLFPEKYDFYPRTWSLPGDWRSFAQQFDPHTRKSLGNQTFIVKPAMACQGRGIYLTRRLEDIVPNVQQVAQSYIAKPFLIDGLKFDLRIYILVTSVDPLRVWLHEDGLCRFATMPYRVPTQANVKHMTMHLTNYAINKGSDAFVFNTDASRGDTGSKRTLTWFRAWLDSHGYSSIAVWGRIADFINKLLLAGQPHLTRQYRTVVPIPADTSGNMHSMRCFELLGLDVLFDSELRPYLLEVNHSPSLTCDSPLDLDIKTKVIGETLDLLRLRSGDVKRTKQAEAAAARSRLFPGNNGKPALPALPGASSLAGSGNADTVPEDTAPAVSARAVSANYSGSGGIRTTVLRPTSASVRSTGPTNLVSSATLHRRARQGEVSDEKGDAAISLVRTETRGPAQPQDTNRSFLSAAKPQHVRTTAHAFQAGAQRIPADHALHEIKVSNGFRLIFPPCDPAVVEDAVWVRNAAEHAKMAVPRSTDQQPSEPDGAGDVVLDAVSEQASSCDSDQSTISSPAVDLAANAAGMAAARRAIGATEDSKAELRERAKRLRAQLDAGKSSLPLTEVEDSDDSDSDDRHHQQHAPTTSSMTLSLGRAQASAMSQRILGYTSAATHGLTMRDGVPKPYYPPWDTSIEAYAERIALYKSLEHTAADEYSRSSSVLLLGGATRKSIGSALSVVSSVGSSDRPLSARNPVPAGSVLPATLVSKGGRDGVWSSAQRRVPPLPVHTATEMKLSRTTATNAPMLARTQSAASVLQRSVQPSGVLTMTAGTTGRYSDAGSARSAETIPVPSSDRTERPAGVPTLPTQSNRTDAERTIQAVPATLLSDLDKPAPAASIQPRPMPAVPPAAICMPAGKSRVLPTAHAKPTTLMRAASFSTGASWTSVTGRGASPGGLPHSLALMQLRQEGNSGRVETSTSVYRKWQGGQSSAPRPAVAELLSAATVTKLVTPASNRPGASR